MIRYIILIVIAGIVGATLAKSKGRSQLLWFCLCALIPLLVIAILFLPMAEKKGFTKKCSYCDEIIKAKATVCKFCGMINQNSIQ